MNEVPFSLKDTVYKSKNKKRKVSAKKNSKHAKDGFSKGISKGILRKRVSKCSSEKESGNRQKRNLVEGSDTNREAPGSSLRAAFSSSPYSIKNDTNVSLYGPFRDEDKIIIDLSEINDLVIDLSDDDQSECPRISDVDHENTIDPIATEKSDSPSPSGSIPCDVCNESSIRTDSPTRISNLSENTVDDGHASPELMTRARTNRLYEIPSVNGGRSTDIATESELPIKKCSVVLERLNLEKYRTMLPNYFTPNNSLDNSSRNEVVTFENPSRGSSLSEPIDATKSCNVSYRKREISSSQNYDRYFEVVSPVSPDLPLDLSCHTRRSD